MGRHSQRHGSARRAHVSLGAATLVGLACSASYALAAPVATPMAAPIAVPAAPVAVATPTTTPATTATTAATATTDAAKTTTTAATATTTAAKAKPRTSKRVTTTCDLSGPPVFGDPAHPDEITNRDCGYTDAQGRERSRDPWIDGQLLDAAR